MKTNLFKPMVAGWSAKLRWSKDELSKATKSLAAISAANAGEIAPDAQLDAETGDGFTLRRAEDALARRVNPYAELLRGKAVRPRFARPLQQQAELALPGLVAYEWADCIDVNADDADALCKLPGISPDLARKIVESRAAAGRFSGLEQLTSVAGIDAKGLAALKNQAFCGTAEPAMSMTAELSTFVNEPTFRNYVGSIAETKDSYIWSIGKSANPKEHVLAELKATLDDVSANKYGAARNLHFTRASSVLSERTVRQSAQEIGKNEIRAIDCGALLHDGQYLPFVRDLIGVAKESISVMMFFMKYEDGTNYVVNSLLKSLIDAHNKGVGVRVILDKDAQDAVTESRLINEPAFQVLKKNNVPVVYDREDRMTHSKFAVVDGRHTVIGSHNWTGGSFLAYDDTSVYVGSRELGQKCQGFFDAIWNEYNKTENAPGP